MQSIDSTVPTVSNGENKDQEESIEFESAKIRSSSKSEGQTADADVKEEATEVVAQA